MEDNIRLDLKEIDINLRNSVDSAQYRDYQRALVNALLEKSSVSLVTSRLY